MLVLPTAASAYNVVDLPVSMTFSEAMGIFNADDITRVTVSDTAEEKYIELDRDGIRTFFETAMNMTVERRINATPFRGIAVNVYTESDVKSYYLNSGVQIGLYGNENYVCYKLNDEDTARLLYLDSDYKDAQEKANGEEIHRAVGNDFLKLPSAPWAKPFASEAAAKSLLPYEFTDKYSDNITREQFCVLLGNLIAVHENYVSIEDYMRDTGGAYLRNYFEDCTDADDAVNILFALGIVNGRDETHFDPGGMITREEAATLLCKVAERYIWIDTETYLSYSDADSVSPWARFYVTWANEYGIMTGITDTEFAPQNGYTVEQAVATVVRLYDLIQ